MGTGNFTDDFKRDAVAQITERGYRKLHDDLLDQGETSCANQPTHRAEIERYTDSEKQPIKAGQSAREIWPDEPAKAAQRDVDACWTLKIGGKVRYRPDGTPLPMIATPVFGYKSHISIDRRFGFIREPAVTSASAAEEGNSSAW